MTQDMAATILILTMIALMAARTVPIIRAKTSGSPLLEINVPLLFRALSQRVNVISILVVLMLGSGVVGERWISHGLFLFAVVAVAGIICLPQRYQFTSDGVAVNRASFRPWSDFQTWDASGNVIRLHAAQRTRSLRLYVTGRDRESVLNLIKRQVSEVTAGGNGRRRARK